MMEAAQVEDVQAEKPKHPVIVLGGTEWEIPVLAPKQNMIVVPILLDLIPRILNAREEAIEGKTFGYLARFLDMETYGKMCTAVFTALTRGHPAIKSEEFLNMEIGTLELISAVFVIGRQAGLLTPTAVKET
jgi:hypothetical protein